jgi:hypothetical protein
MSQEFKVSVSSGKYTFVQPKDDYKIHILRYGESWVQDLDGSNALFSLMAELDAARVVLEAARKWNQSFSIDAKPRTVQSDNELMDALAKHDRLVDDHQPPSDWTK